MTHIDPEKMVAAMKSDFAQECLLMALQDSEYFDGRDELIEMLREQEEKENEA